MAYILLAKAVTVLVQDLLRYCIGPEHHCLLSLHQTLLQQLTVKTLKRDYGCHSFNLPVLDTCQNIHCKSVIVGSIVLVLFVSFLQCPRVPNVNWCNSQSMCAPVVEIDTTKPARTWMLLVHLFCNQNSLEIWKMLWVLELTQLKSATDNWLTTDSISSTERRVLCTRANKKASLRLHSVAGYTVGVFVVSLEISDNTWSRGVLLYITTAIFGIFAAVDETVALLGVCLPLCIASRLPLSPPFPAAWR